MSSKDTAFTGDWPCELEGKIRAALREICFGTVTLVIQNRRVIQIEKNEKIRLK